MGAPICFVIMPFGKKPLRDGSTGDYDFDKVYRVIIQRAVRLAGMEPLRADERTGSAIIHSEMFKDLRDQSVVLADLSLENPNVFYELGIRHVMSPSGTVLICRKGSDLPFDIRLSRVVFYDYDGKSLDYEEAERVVAQLQAVLQEARKGTPDSPVYAFLESVLADGAAAHTATGGRSGSHPWEPGELLAFQRRVATLWLETGKTIADLEAERNSVIGVRCLGSFCLEQNPMPAEAEDVARSLVDGEQYEFANQIFDRLHRTSGLPVMAMLSYATSYSEANPNLAGATRALELVDEALAKVPDRPEHLLDRAACYRRQSGLRHWRWQLSRTGADLEAAIQAYTPALENTEKARQTDHFQHPGYLAQTRLKAMLLLRFREENPERPDSEGHRDAILSVRALHTDDPVGVSYLNWYQAITLADAGSAQASQQKALAALAADAPLKSKSIEIGRRQYRTMRRFLEQNSRVFRNRTLIGNIAQLLIAGEQN